MSMRPLHQVPEHKLLNYFNCVKAKTGNCKIEFHKIKRMISRLKVKFFRRSNVFFHFSQDQKF